MREGTSTPHTDIDSCMDIKITKCFVQRKVLTKIASLESLLITKGYICARLPIQCVTEPQCCFGTSIQERYRNIYRYKKVKFSLYLTSQHYTMKM
jgi:hypothetical protein